MSAKQTRDLWAQAPSGELLECGSGDHNHLREGVTNWNAKFLLHITLCGTLSGETLKTSTSTCARNWNVNVLLHRTPCGNLHTTGTRTGNWNVNVLFSSPLLDEGIRQDSSHFHPALCGSRRAVRPAWDGQEILGTAITCDIHRDRHPLVAQKRAEASLPSPPRCGAPIVVLPTWLPAWVLETRTRPQHAHAHNTHVCRRVAPLLWATLEPRRLEPTWLRKEGGGGGSDTVVANEMKLHNDARMHQIVGSVSLCTRPPRPCTCVQGP